MGEVKNLTEEIAHNCALVLRQAAFGWRSSALLLSIDYVLVFFLCLAISFGAQGLNWQIYTEKFLPPQNAFVVSAVFLGAMAALAMTLLLKLRTDTTKNSNVLRSIKIAFELMRGALSIPAFVLMSIASGYSFDLSEGPLKNECGFRVLDDSSPDEEVAKMFLKNHCSTSLDLRENLWLVEEWRWIFFLFLPFVKPTSNK